MKLREHLACVLRDGWRIERLSARTWRIVHPQGTTFAAGCGPFKRVRWWIKYLDGLLKRAEERHLEFARRHGLEGV